MWCVCVCVCVCVCARARAYVRAFVRVVRACVCVCDVGLAGFLWFELLVIIVLVISRLWYLNVSVVSIWILSNALSSYRLCQRLALYKKFIYFAAISKTRHLIDFSPGQQYWGPWALGLFRNRAQNPVNNGLLDFL